MTKLGYVLGAIKEIECPVDQLEDKIKSAYKELTNGDTANIRIDRSESKDANEIITYNVRGEGAGNPAITVLVKEGSEHYVANVEDAFPS